MKNLRDMKKAEKRKEVEEKTEDLKVEPESSEDCNSKEFDKCGKFGTKGTPSYKKTIECQNEAICWLKCHD